MKNRIFILVIQILWFLNIQAQSIESFVTSTIDPDCFILASQGTTVPVLGDNADFSGVKLAISNLLTDFKNVTGTLTPFYNEIPLQYKKILIIGTVGKSKYINQLIGSGLINNDEIEGKNEKFIIQTIKNPLAGIDEALVIAGSDKRGTIYGIYELSRQIGVSPWYFWADTPIRKSQNIYIKNGKYTEGEPTVRYRGIFINDEAPALTTWVKDNYGGFNHQFYEKVFELVLRLKGNFVWPAMWGSAFFDDDTLNGSLADEMGIVISTSHHEPMGRAHNEWRRYGSGNWDYTTNSKNLNDFWREGLKRMKDWETVVTIGMRGDGDEPMSDESNIDLLEKIVSNQREIISQVTGKDAKNVPQVWALYKEVQDYYDQGMRVPDDVTLLLCDDNWGNIRKLPDLHAPKRQGGYGMYYHFDYVGGPRNYKWLNVSQVQRIWEQMNLSWQYGVDRIWVVNVGDLKPMEYPISFFLDMAWNPAAFNADNLFDHTVAFCEEQFGGNYPREAARLINLYTKYNRRVTPELLDANTYSLQNYNEFEKVVTEYQNLLLNAFRLYNLMPAQYRDTYDQLVLFPIQAMANLYEMYFAVAKNRDLIKDGNPEANIWAAKVKDCFRRDSLLTVHYHKDISGGKWNHMMDQVHIGYTYWQQPPRNSMPDVQTIPETDCKGLKGVFLESEGCISIESTHYSRLINTKDVKWLVIPDLGRTCSAITTAPVIHTSQTDASNSASLEYDIELQSTGAATLTLYLSPTLNFNENRGLSYAISIDKGTEQVVNFNQKYDQQLHDTWLANSIIESKTKHFISTPGMHTIRYRAIDPGIVLQKLVLDTGGVLPSFLGPPESKQSFRGMN